MAENTTVNALVGDFNDFYTTVNLTMQNVTTETQGETSFLLDTPDNRWIEVQGTGFQWVDGRPVGGTVTRIVVGDSGVEEVEANVSLALADVYSALVGATPADSLIALFGTTRFNGGAGSDLWAGNSSANTFDGRGGDDSFYCGDGGDLGFGGDGNDSLVGRGGSDRLYGGAGDDTLEGGDGDDALYGEAGTDIMRGGDGNDFYRLEAGEIADEEGADGSDTIIVDYSFNLATSAQIRGEIEKLYLVGAADIDATGNAFDNRIEGNNGDNILNGAAGNDFLFDGGGNDKVIGGAGNDYFYDSAGNDILQGGAGNDIYQVAWLLDRDVLDESVAGSGGIDEVQSTVSFDLRNTAIVKGAIENLSLYANDINGIGNTLANIIRGSYGTNRLSGNAGNDKLFGNEGNDILNGGTGADHLSGGTGLDRAAYASSTTAVTVSLANAALNAGGAKGDTFNSIENLSGSSFNDTLLGTHGANLISGGSGNDVIKGYRGNDTLAGGAGKDIFIFAATLNASTNVDVITDYNIAADTIQLDNAYFAALTTLGTLAISAFRANTTGLASDANDRIIYETDTGELYYDANGTGAGGGILFAKLDIGLGLTAADFVVI